MVCKLLCGRKRSDPHHLGFQPRPLGRKVVDKFAVPHHRAVHRSRDERAWWRQAGIDPIKIARRLWKETHGMGQPRSQREALPRPHGAHSREQITALRELAEVVGVTLTEIDEAPGPAGIAIHESGTARMGSDRASSVLDPHNQCWEAEGLYVTDAACFPSQGSQNPTVTILALTARACDHALRSDRPWIPTKAEPISGLTKNLHLTL